MSRPPKGEREARLLRRPTRRELLIAGLAGTGALAVGVYGGYKLGRRAERRARVVPPRSQPFAPDALIAIDRDGEVTIWLGQPDVGQGVATSLPVSLADELGADAARVRLVLAPANEVYGRQFTAVSRSVRDNWLDVRRAGAAAREVLLATAAAGFECEVHECEARDGFVRHVPTGRSVAFAALVDDAARRPVPADPPLKAPESFVYMGADMPRLDHAAKVDGTATFGLDARLPGMAFAVVARPPSPRGSIRSFDDEAARRVPGVLDVFRIDSGIVVLARHSHAAIRGREALKLELAPAPDPDWDSARISARLRELADGDGAEARTEGRGLQSPHWSAPGARVVRAEYELPFLAHATMEPMNCTADVRDDACTVLVPSQAPQSARDECAALLGLPRDRVRVQPTWIGGAFGRRVAQDFVREAVQASRHARRPVQVLWTREDDFAHDHYRPCSLHRLAAVVGDDGLPVAWHHRIVTPSILRQDPRFSNAVDPVAVEGAVELPYEIADLSVELVFADMPFQLGFWRSVGHSFNAFAVECFVDELAATAGLEPTALRRRLLSGSSAARHRAVLELATERAGPASEASGAGRGVAVHASFGSFVAMCVDAHVEGADVTVHRVTAAVDCGFAVHPDGVRAQIEGAVVFALSAAMYGDVRFEAGAATARNFDDQPVLRIDACPQVDVHLVANGPEPLGGVGEIGVPPLAPALANAVFAATGRRLRTLPLRLT